MTVHLTLKKEPKTPVNAECINPDVFAGKTLEEILALKLWEGNRQVTLNTLFNIEADAAKAPMGMRIEVSGCCSKIRRIGARMTNGEVIIRGDVGMHLGEEMRGGSILVYGNADSWCGAMMKDGRIEVHGNAGDFLGAAYRGANTLGMRGGAITVHGNTGNETGYYMQGGVIRIQGSAGQFTGVHMRDGVIMVGGRCNARAGACMTGGKILLLNGVEAVLPSFTIDGVKDEAKVEKDSITGPFYVFVGDLTVDGDGKLFVSKTHNPQLSFYEKLL